MGEKFLDEIGAVVAIGHDDKTGFCGGVCEGVAVKTFIVAAIVDETIVLDLPTEPPGACVLALDDFDMGSEHLADGLWSEPESVGFFWVEDFEHEFRVVGGGAAERAG